MVPDTRPRLQVGQDIWEAYESSGINNPVEADIAVVIRPTICWSTGASSIDAWFAASLKLRRIRAEVLLDAISQVTETKNKFRHRAYMWMPSNISYQISNYSKPKSSR